MLTRDKNREEEQSPSHARIRPRGRGRHTSWGLNTCTLSTKLDLKFKWGTITPSSKY